MKRTYGWLSPRIPQKLLGNNSQSLLGTPSGIRRGNMPSRTESKNKLGMVTESSCTSGISEQIVNPDQAEELKNSTSQGDRQKLMNIIVIENELVQAWLIFWVQDEVSEIGCSQSKLLSKPMIEPMDNDRVPSSPTLGERERRMKVKPDFRSILSYNKNQTDTKYQGSETTTFAKNTFSRDAKENSHIIFLQKPKKGGVTYGAQLKQKWSGQTAESGCNPYSVKTNSKIDNNGLQKSSTSDKRDLTSTFNIGKVSELKDVSRLGSQQVIELRRERTHDPRVPASLGNTLVKDDKGALFDNWILSARAKIVKSNIPVRQKYGGPSSQKTVTNNQNTSRHSGMSSERHMAIRRPSIMLKSVSSKHVVFGAAAQVKRYVPDTEIC